MQAIEVLPNGNMKIVISILLRSCSGRKRIVAPEVTNAAAEWKRMHDPDAMKVFPYVRYHARNDARTRSDHGNLDGKIFHKDDPFLKTHTPPWEFNCRCWLEEITAKEAGKEPDLIQEKTPADKVTVDSRSGFSFDPEHVFEKFELDSIKNVKQKQSIVRDMRRFAETSDIQVSFSGTPEQQKAVCNKPENLDEIKDVINSVKKSIDNHEANTEYIFPEVQCSLGFISKERFESIGLQPDDNVEVIFESPGKSDYGMKHWKKHHLEDWKNQDFMDYLLQMLQETIWNPKSNMRISLESNAKRIAVSSPDGKYIANLWRRGEKWVYSIQSAWDWEQSGSKG